MKIRRKKTWTLFLLMSPHSLKLCIAVQWWGTLRNNLVVSFIIITNLVSCRRQCQAWKTWFWLFGSHFGGVQRYLALSPNSFYFSSTNEDLTRPPYITFALLASQSSIIIWCTLRAVAVVSNHLIKYPCLADTTKKNT